MPRTRTHRLPLPRLVLALAILPLALACASSPAAVEPAVPTAAGAPSVSGDDFGVLVMAHGGSETWDAAILEAVGTMDGDYPVEVAFGMAAAESLQEATTRLEEQGVKEIGVVRLFVSGESWLERTRQILGMEPGAPRREDAPAPSGHHHHDFAATFWRVESSATFAMSLEGLSEADEMSRVLVDRVRGLSDDTSRESVLILAHGPGDDGENERWIANMKALAAPLETMGFRAVEVQTLREDWTGKREQAEREIRGFVEAAGTDDGRCLVVPFRVFGFGPYAEVLEGLDYVSDGLGLLPHEAVSAWMERQAESLRQGPFVTPVAAPTPLASSASRP